MNGSSLEKISDMFIHTKIEREACHNNLAPTTSSACHLAVGDAIASMNMTYGSDNSIAEVEKIYKTLTINAYISSCKMAKDRGSFPVHDHEREKGHPYLERLWSASPEVYDLSKEYGRRNIALTTTAPAGSVSVLTQTTSGIEPAFLVKYMRRKKINQEADPHAKVDYIDDVGDAWQEFDVYHHNFKKWMEVTGLTEPEDSPYHGATSNDIDWVQKVKVQAAAQKWVCHAISNTTNLPNDIDVDTVKKIYMEGWKSGCKGVTIYRDGCRSGVLVSTEVSSDEEAEVKLQLSKAITKASNTIVDESSSALSEKVKSVWKAFTSSMEAFSISSWVPIVGMW